MQQCTDKVALVAGAVRPDKPDWVLLLLFFLQSCKEKAQPHAQDPPQKASRMCTSSWDVLGRAALSPHCPLAQAWMALGRVWMSFAGFLQTHINPRAIPMYQNTQNRFAKENQPLSPTCSTHITQRFCISDISLFSPVFIHLTKAPCSAQVFPSQSDINAPNFCRNWMSVMDITEQGSRGVGNTRSSDCSPVDVSWQAHSDPQ